MTSWFISAMHCHDPKYQLGYHRLTNHPTNQPGIASAGQQPARCPVTTAPFVTPCQVCCRHSPRHWLDQPLVEIGIVGSYVHEPMVGMNCQKVPLLRLVCENLRLQMFFSYIKETCSYLHVYIRMYFKRSTCVRNYL